MKSKESKTMDRPAAAHFFTAHFMTATLFAAFFLGDIPQAAAQPAPQAAARPVPSNIIVPMGGYVATQGLGPRFVAPDPAVPKSGNGIPARPASMRLALITPLSEPSSPLAASPLVPAPAPAPPNPREGQNRQAAPVRESAQPTNFISLLFSSKSYPLDVKPPNERIVYVPYAAPEPNPYTMRSTPYGAPYGYGNGITADGYWYPNMPVSQYPMPYPMPGVPLPRYAAQTGNHLAPGTPAQGPPPMYPAPPQLDERERFFWYGQ